MAELTDEEKVKQAFGDVESSKQDETTEKPETGSEEEAKAEVEEKTEEAEKTEESESETTTEPLTKPFPWLKGETPEEWTKELQTAYENSTNEALRIKKERDDYAQLIEEAKRVIANQGKTEEKTAESTSPLQADTLPEIQYAKDLMQRDLVTSFDEFAKQYPQAREPEGFAQIEKASPGAAQAFFATYGRMATYPELFEKTAALLGWQPSSDQGKRDQAIRDQTTSSQTTSSSKPVKTVKITDEQLAVARRLFPNESDEDIVKGLAPYVT